MRALVLRALEGPAALAGTTVPVPAPDDRLVHINVEAAGVSYPDLLLTRGQYQLRLEPPFVPGSEVAGVVRSAPDGSGFALGDRVMALTTSGGWAERVAVAPELVAQAPASLDPVRVAAMVMNHQTAWFALTRRAQLAPGETVVVLGAAGGVGSACVQVASRLGARVIAVVHREGAEDYVAGLGADEVVALRDGWMPRVRELTGGLGADVVADPVGGDAFDDAVRVLAPGGRLLVLGFAGGGIPSIKVNRLLLRNAAVVGAGWGEALRRDPCLFARGAEALAGFVADGMMPPVTERRALADGRDALELLERGGVLGKVVLEV